MRFSSKDILEQMEGAEVWSIHYADLVGVKDGRFHLSHSGRDFKPTPSEVRILWDEYFE